MNRDIIIIIGQQGPNWQIVDQEFTTCPQSPVYYSATALIPMDARVDCDPAEVTCIHTLNGQQTQGRAKRRN